jgi:aspartyl-tRNA(Asn)/glutamyl-tRNA(Gln) amidotransferase subunit A
MTLTTYAGVAECAAAIRRGELSSVELVQALLDRIERIDGRINAFIALCPERALEQARELDAQARRGEWRGPLHGVPYATKDLIDVAGLPTTCHSKILETNVAQADAVVTRRLAAAGAVLIGKTALHEFATGGPSFDLPWPPARNPWNPGVHPGGSSSGSAAAVAAGMVPFAIGTDTGGSVRHPASVCGVTGIKPTYGAVSVEGVFPLSFTLDHVGPLARNAADAALVLAAIVDPAAAAKMRLNAWGLTPASSGSDPGLASERGLTPASLGSDPGLISGLRGLRIGVIDEFYSGADVNPEIVRATEAAIELMKAAGAHVTRLALSPLATYNESGRTILQAEAYAIHAGWLRTRPADYGKRGRQRLLAGAVISAERYIRALQVRTHLQQEFDDAMRDIDVAVTASSLELAAAIDDEPAVDRTYDKQARTPFNVLGVPAISVLAGFSKSGLPIGLQIAGRPYHDGKVLHAANAFERAAGLLDRRPPEFAQ